MIRYEFGLKDSCVIALFCTYYIEESLRKSILPLNKLQSIIPCSPSSNSEDLLRLFLL